ncbi:putative ATP-binding protein [Escherichia coli]|uniref:Putative ATP-binding protein n=1 Tax=Escherichia coli TaxID=562 RepID=A0A485JH31_ECOLX|nr:putative ATP-binding protein [Escherichia coli]
MVSVRAFGGRVKHKTNTPGGSVTDDFAPDGQLAKAIPGFKPREPQRQMAVAVTQAIEKGQPLVVEAGTGTGKTYAYLAPALRAKRKSLSRPVQKRCRISSTAAICQQSQRH